MSCIPQNLFTNDLQISAARKRQKFTPQEDDKLKYLISENGTHNWNIISQEMPGRSAKQCRDRYCNYLSAPHSNLPWRTEEDQILLSLLSVIGTKWVEISRYLPGRSGPNVKNRWYKHLNKIYSYQPNEDINNNIIDIKKETNDQLINSNDDDNKNEIDPYDKLIMQYSISALLI
ncbi:hypothetical protein M9Y10_033502 [Tritrichomonas musculus]|uniref:Myb-like DNA-binding domain containing protein n=1 Tax=Tritrichomonas musculus TaxID=1915356 RepID=A0ABR2KCZ4_9EUKA